MILPWGSASKLVKRVVPQEDFSLKREGQLENFPENYKNLGRRKKMLRKFWILLPMNGVVPEKCVLLPQKWLKIPFFAQNIGEKGVILPWGSTFKIRKGVPTLKGSTGHTCRSRTTLPP